MSFAPPIDPPGTGTNRPSSQAKKVAYFYDSDVGQYAFNTGHCMKPYRIRMAHSLVMSYRLHNKMEIYRAKPATKHEMTQFHTDDYVNFLERVTPDNEANYPTERAKHNIGEDCPAFDGLFEFCGISAGGSMEGAARLNRGKCDIAVNWAGGLHHAKKNEASGFCYINDIVLAVIELLRFHKRVLYIDIDVHHGDGVEEAFYTTDRVMCVSFHKYGEFFPGTGDLRDIGIGTGKRYSVNFPLRDGIDDASYKDLFESVIRWTMEFYQPDAIVLQCGADSVSGDRLGSFNLSMRGHANCVNFVKSFNVPTMVLGGGGYTIRNVARVWAYETGQVLDTPMSTVLPFTDHYEHYAPDFELDVRPSNMMNANTPEYLQKVKTYIYDNLRRTQVAPSVQLQDVPRYPMAMDETIDEQDERLDDEVADQESEKDRRYNQRSWDKKIHRDDEFSESEDESNEGTRVAGRPRRRGIMDFQNPYATPDIDPASISDAALVAVSLGLTDGHVKAEDQALSNIPAKESPAIETDLQGAIRDSTTEKPPPQQDVADDLKPLEPKDQAARGQSEQSEILGLNAPHAADETPHADEMDMDHGTLPATGDAGMSSPGVVQKIDSDAMNIESAAATAEETMTENQSNGNESITKTSE